MGRLSRRRREKQLSRLSESELLALDAQSDLTTMLVAAAFGGMLTYCEIAPDGRELDDAERASALDQLQTGAMAILTTAREQAVVDTLPATVPLTETLMLLRVMQQALIFALSDDHAVRGRALDVKMVATYGRLAEIKWREHEGRRRPMRP